jgi:hypothetical protein
VFLIIFRVHILHIYWHRQNSRTLCWRDGSIKTIKKVGPLGVLSPSSFFALFLRTFGLT